jgi:hypothetical protein
MPLGLGVILLIDDPFAGRSLLRMPHHENLWKVAESIVDVLAGMPAYVDNPIKAL